VAIVDQAESSERVSTACLPSPELVKALVAEARHRFRSDQQGKSSGIYPSIEEGPKRLYNKQCTLNVNARDLAVMGARLADGGVNPITKEPKSTTTLQAKGKNHASDKTRYHHRLGRD
jgi:hypothetical protein